MSPAAAARMLSIASFVLLIAPGPLTAAAAHPPFAGPLSLFIDLVGWPLDGAVAALTKEGRLLAGILGGILTALGLMLALIVAPALKRGDDEIRRAGIIAILGWFFVDSSGSIAAGFAGNAVANIGILAALLYPMLAVKRPQSGAVRGA